MAATHPPVAKAVYVCDDVRPDPIRQQLDLSGVLTVVRAPASTPFPYILGRMCVFAQLEDGSGDADLHAVVVSAATGQALFRSAVHPVRFPSRLAVVSVNIRLVNCRFPTAGE